MCVTAEGALALSVLSNFYFFSMYSLWHCPCKICECVFCLCLHMLRSEKEPQQVHMSFPQTGAYRTGC